MIKIRKEQPQDIPTIHEVNMRAFGQLLARIFHELTSIHEISGMILVLNESVMQGISGVAKYRPEFV